MRVLVTGAGGFLGQVLTRGLVDGGHDVTAVVRSSRSALADSGARIAVADLRDRDSLLAIPGRTEMDSVIHLGALKNIQNSASDPLAFYESNATGTINLLRAIDRGTKPAQIVYASTMSVYGSRAAEPDEATRTEPGNPYASSKLAGELIARDFAGSRDADLAILRFANLAGGVGGISDSGGGIIPKALTSARDGAAVPVNGDGSAVRDYVHVADAARAVLGVLEQGGTTPGRRLYNVGSGEGTSVRDVLDQAERVTGRPIVVDRRPAVAEASRVVANIGRITTDLGWRPMCSLDRIVGDAWAAMGTG